MMFPGQEIGPESLTRHVKAPTQDGDCERCISPRYFPNALIDDHPAPFLQVYNKTTRRM